MFSAGWFGTVDVGNRWNLALVSTAEGAAILLLSVWPALRRSMLPPTVFWRQAHSCRPLTHHTTRPWKENERRFSECSQRFPSSAHHSPRNYQGVLPIPPASWAYVSAATRPPAIGRLSDSPKRSEGGRKPRQSSSIIQGSHSLGRRHPIPSILPKTTIQCPREDPETTVMIPRCNPGSK
ncbi:hypothetical protein LZ30DRAFT_721553 [Colletotrichum cereale]|nr:hypothetical protein LZ30DRAFT_721553 [Colletotrichum cereale]